ncbi:MAG: glycerol-3-phosphate acyltransferase [Chloroflexota bacterium]|nr:glycerol-3-phosphate acyltransferase [Chloroflexota bacterium]
MHLSTLYLYAFVVGSFPSAYIMARIVKGMDLRQCGSGSLGISNVVTHLGKAWIIPICVLDVGLKGASPVLMGMFVFHLNSSNFLLIVAPLIALIGHNWCFVLKLRGGRGISVIVGSLIIIDPLLTLVGSLMFVVAWFVTRKNVPISVLLALLFLPMASLGLDRGISVTAFLITGLFLTVSKRLLGNGESKLSNAPGHAIWRNRLFLDRDIADRNEWIYRK